MLKSAVTDEYRRALTTELLRRKPALVNEAVDAILVLTAAESGEDYTVAAALVQSAVRRAEEFLQAIP